MPMSRSSGGGESGLQKFLKGVPIVVGPILYVCFPVRERTRIDVCVLVRIQFTRRIVQLWYTRKENAEGMLLSYSCSILASPKSLICFATSTYIESHLKSLLSKQRATVEDIKKKTNYYSTKNLIEKYDDSSSSNSNSGPSPLRTPVRRAGPGQQQQQPPSTVTPLRPVPGQFSQQRPSHLNAKANGNQQPQQDPNNPFITSSANLHATPQRPPKKQWYDKVADALLGDDERATEAREKMNRYALICRRCFSHNGLVKEEEVGVVREYYFTTSFVWFWEIFLILINDCRVCMS